MKTITVRVLGWAKYNPRKDIKHPTWFALSNRVLEDQDLYDLSDAEFRAFIYILSQASQKLTDTVTLNLDRALNVSKVTKKALLSTLDKLAVYQIMDRVQESGSTAYAVPPAPGHDTTIQDNTNNTEQDTAEPSPANVFDFERAYKSYPRHEGKEAGMKNLRQQIRTAEQFEQFESAVVHYAEICIKRKTEKQFIKQWSSFVGTARTGNPWHEFIERPKELDDVNSQKAAAADRWLEEMTAQGAS